MAGGKDLSKLRNDSRDKRCFSSDNEWPIRQSSDEHYEGQTVNLDPGRCLDIESFDWYRRIFSECNPGHDQSISDQEFLHTLGVLSEKSGVLRPTRAGIFLFGTVPALLQILPRPVVDYQWINAEWSDAVSVQWWTDRFVAECNLVQTWKALTDYYLQHEGRASSVHSGRLRMEDMPPGDIAFREAVINLLIHQDYSDHTRKPVIQFFRDRAIFWNPGDAFLPLEELLEPGEKEVRNPCIASAFQRIGLSKQAGTGIHSVFQSWRKLGCIPPVIKNDKGRKAFQLDLFKKQLLSEER